jgi:FkbM family methyltransferase
MNDLLKKGEQLQKQPVAWDESQGEIDSPIHARSHSEKNQVQVQSLSIQKIAMVAISKSRLKQRTAYTRQEKYERLLLFVMGVLGGIYLLMTMSNTATSLTSSVAKRLSAVETDNHIHLGLISKNQPMLSESYNAIAMDIINTLDCKTLLNKTVPTYGEGGGMYDDYVPAGGEGQNAMKDGGEGDGPGRSRRRLEEKEKGDDGDDSHRQEARGDTIEAAADGGSIKDNNMQVGMHDDVTADWNSYEEVNAKLLFCLAAATTSMPAEKIKQHKDRIKCDATGTKQEALLDVWSSARAQMAEALLLKTVGLATESTRTLGKHTVNLWSPRSDDGMNYILSQVSNQDESARMNGNNFFGLSHNLGPDHLYVDVGSCLGITTLAVIMEYPKTKVVSFEPAAPNWLMQEINMKCNLEEDQQPTLLMAGIGPHTKEVMAAKLLWRPSAVTATRAWTPAQEKISGEDEELFVQLRPWKSLLAEAGVPSTHHIDVLHIDCEGCEYK